MKLLILLLQFFITASIIGGGLPFNPERGLVEVDIVLDGKIKGRFGIDTGADFLYIDRKFAIENKLKIIPQALRPVTGVKGQSSATPISLKSFEIGDAKLINLRATAIDLNAFIKDTSMGLPDGVIGYSILKQFYITIDFPEQTIYLEVEKPDFLRGRNYKTIPFTQYKHLILVKSKINNLTEAKLILDYCASYTSFSQKIADKLSITKRKGKVNEISIGEGISLGPVNYLINDFKKLKKALPRSDFEGILGYSFLYKYKVTIDYKNKLLYFHNR